MELKEFSYDGEKILISDEVEDMDVDIFPENKQESMLDKTQEFNVLTEDELFSETMTDIFGDNNE